MSSIGEEIIYPNINNPDFNKQLQSHPIFNQYKYKRDEYILEKMIELSEKKCSDTGGYIYKNIQLFVSTFLSINSPYNGLLLYHGVGVGKSCSSILIANNFKDYVKKNNKKIIILTSPAIQDGFKNEIFNTDKELNKIDLNEFTCTSTEYSNDLNDFLNNNPDLNKNDIEKIDKQFREGIIGEYFEIFGYQEFVNKYKSLIEISEDVYNKEQINTLFSNTVFIIDEVHNLRDNQDESEGEDEKKTKITKKTTEIKGIKKIIQGIIESLDDPIKLVLLSATPMYDMYTELNYIINLLLLNDKKKELPQSVINDYINNNNSEAYEEIKNKTRGYISYIKGNDPTIFPLILYPENNNKLYFETNLQGNINNSENINVYLCEMNKYQSTLFKNIKTVSKNKLLKEHYSNITFPENRKKKEVYTFSTLFKFENTYISTDSEASNELLNNIEQYSIKISELLKNINECKKGKIFIYHSKHLGDYGGTSMLKIILEHNGYSEKIVNKENISIKNSYNTSLNSKSDNFKGYYILAPVDKNLFPVCIKHFNKKTNNYGEEIKIIIGTTNMFEGVSLSNIRQIHLLEPWYNMSRNEQIIGRGVRQCSHIDLPFENRNLTVFNYVAICDKNDSEKYEKYDDGYIVKYKKNASKELDADIRRLQLATEKTINITKLDNILKLNAIDCYLNKNVNQINIKEAHLDSEENIIEFKDYKDDLKFISFTSGDVEICEDLEKTENDVNNYQYKTFLNKNLIKNTSFFIKTVFKKGIDSLNPNIINKVYYTYEELFGETQQYNKELDEELFKISLQELILSKETFYNKFNNLGYIIIKGKYYIFKNISSENINIPFEFSNYPYTIKIDNIKNFTDYSVELTTPAPIISQKQQSKSSTKNLPETSIKQPSETSTKKSPETSTKKSNKIELFTEIFNNCKKNGLEILASKDINNIYITLYRSFTNKTNKYHALTSLNTNDYNFKDASEKNFYENIFNQLFKKIFDKSKFSSDIDNDLLNRFYENYFIIPFIFNYSEFITIHLKCIFYKKFIVKKELNVIEQNIFNHYENLIVSEDPLIFKFIDWSGNSSVLGDSNNSYTYDYLGIVFYEYYDDEWIFYNKIYKSSKTTLQSRTQIDLNFYKIRVSSESKISLDFLNKEFIIQELYKHYPEDSEKEKEKEWNKIYNTFDYHFYTNRNINNGYFRYSGNPDKPFEEISSSDKILKKMDNIIGIPLLSSTDKTDSSFYKLSRNMYPLSLFYSFEEEKGEKILYFKKEFHSEFKNLGEGLKIHFKLKHIIYCILDQIDELNIKMCLEIILDKNITELWKTNEDFKSDIYKILKNINLKNPELDETTYELLKTYLSDNSEEEDSEEEDSGEEDFENIKNIEEINKNLIKNKNKFYVNLPFIYDIINSTYILNTPPEYISFIGYILYDLDKLNFYNKRWILSIFETSLLNINPLKLILTRGKDTATEKSGRFADSYSVTKNSFISAKALTTPFKTKYKSTDK